MTDRSARSVQAATALSLALCLLLLTVAAPAHAEESALAETLYQDGRDLMAKGHTAEACAKFAESLRLDQATGTLLNLAVCHQTLGKLATAWAEFRTGSALAQHDGRQDRARFAQEHLTQIEPQLSYVTIAVAAEARKSGLQVALDGTPLGAPAWNVATPIDPGSHLVEARAPGFVPLSRSVTVGTTAARLTVAVQLVPADPTKSEHAADPVAVSSPGVFGDRRPSAATTGAIVTLAAGAVALAAGGFFGVRAISKWQQRNRECPMDACTAAGVRTGGEAQTAALTADIAVGGGLVALAVGSYLWYRARTNREASSQAPATTTAIPTTTGSVRLTAPPAGTVGLALGMDW